jgi:ABC-type sugar transport system permease subunit
MNALPPQLNTLIWSLATVIFIITGSLATGYGASRAGGLLRLSAAEQRRLFWGVFFASPWIIGFFIFVVGPSLASLYYSFTDYKLGGPINFIGLENYRELLLGEGAHGGRFTQAMFNSFYYAIVGVPLQIMTALIMALLLNQALRGMSVFRLIFYLPVILAGGPAILLAWRYMLASNGGFINQTMQSLGQSFFLFDWLKRGFIFFVEAFNSFYAGIARGDSIGPLKYFVPAALAVLILWTLRGEWDEKKRGRALLAAEIIGSVLALILVARAVIAEPVDAGLFVAFGLFSAAGIGLNMRAGKPGVARAWQLGTLAGLAACGLVVLLDATTPNAAALYLPALALGALPALLTLGTWNASRQRLLLGLAALLGLILLGHFAALDLTPQRLLPLPQMLTLQTTFPAGDLNALKQYGQATFSTFWLYGALVALLALLALGDARHTRAHLAVVRVGLVVFGLLALGALLDGARFFAAHADIAAATGKPNYHFALFNKTIASFPDSSRVPLWLSSELWSKPSLILITMWSSGAGMLIFLAALKGVPQALYEAAEVDGATRWQKFTRITLPMISPAMFYNIVIGVIAAIQTFEAVYIIQTTETRDSLASAAFFLYERTFRQLAIGDGAAVSWVLAAVIIMLTVFQFRFSRWVHYE